MKRRKENKSANKVKTPNQVRKLIWNQSFLSIVKANIMGKSSNIIQIKSEPDLLALLYNCVIESNFVNLVKNLFIREPPSIK